MNRLGLIIFLAALASAQTPAPKPAATRLAVAPSYKDLKYPALRPIETRSSITAKGPIEAFSPMRAVAAIED